MRKAKPARRYDGRGDEVGLMAESIVEYYQDLFDQHVETKVVGDYQGRTYVPGAEYLVSLG